MSKSQGNRDLRDVLLEKTAEVQKLKAEVDK